MIPCQDLIKHRSDLSTAAARVCAANVAVEPLLCSASFIADR